MKHELVRRRLRFTTATAYDPSLAGVGDCVVDRSIYEYSIDEPIVAPQGIEADADTLAEPVTGASAHPLREEPSAVAISTVKRFGVVGLVACALSSAVARRWRMRKH